MPSTFPCPLVVTIPGMLISSSLWNGEFDNLSDNFIPAGVDDYSATNTEMQTMTDPFPASVISRPTSLQGELERVRYILDLIVGKTYWYEHPSISLETIYTSVIPSGTKVVFYQDAAPVGWTAVSIGVSDRFMRAVNAGGGVGGTTGGSGSTPSNGVSLNHTHTVAAHTHTGPDHRHNIDYTSSPSKTTSGQVPVVSLDSQDAPVFSVAGAGAITLRQLLNVTQSSGTGVTGSASPATDANLTTLAFSYASVIIASKD